MSGLIPRSFIDDLLSRIDIVEIISTKVGLKKRGANHVACCPFHDEKSPSFSVSQTKQFFYCFGCGASGNAIGFLMDYERMGFIEAVETLAVQAGMEVPKEAVAGAKSDKQVALYHCLADITVYYQKQLLQHADIIAYVKQRGLSRSNCERFAVGYAPAGWDNVLKIFAPDAKAKQQLTTAGMLIAKDNGSSYDRFRARLMFPIRDPRGRTLGFGGRVLDDGMPKYLNSPETPIFQKGRELYGLYEALQVNRHLDQALIVEGYMDVLALAEQGIDYAVATLGTATSKEHLQCLFRYTEAIIFCFDGDRAGRQAAWRALEVSLPLLQDGRQIRFIFLPDGDDPDSYVLRHKKAGFEQLLQQAVALPDFLLQHLSEDINLDHVDGLARLASQAAPLLVQIPGKILQQLVIERLSQIVRMSPEKLRGLMQAKPTQVAAPQSKNMAPLGRTASPLRLLVSLLLQQPALVLHVEDEAALVQETELAGVALFCQLVTYIKQSSGSTTGQVLEYWRDTEHFQHLQKLAAWEHGVPAEGMEAEFLGALAQLRRLICDEKIENLLLKASVQGLSQAEKQRLQGLISHQQALV